MTNNELREIARAYLATVLRQPYERDVNEGAYVGAAVSILTSRLTPDDKDDAAEEARDVLERYERGRGWTAVIMCGCADWLTCEHPWPTRTSFAPAEPLSENSTTE
jgi:hypothetical protein